MKKSNAYETLLAESVDFIRANGRNEATMAKLEYYLPKCWASELIHEALILTS